MIAGKKVTGFGGGFLLDTNGNPRGNLIAKLFMATPPRRSPRISRRPPTPSTLPRCLRGRRTR